MPIITPDNYPIRYLGRNSEGRTPFFSQSDLFVAAPFTMVGRTRSPAADERPEPVQSAHRINKVRRCAGRAPFRSSAGYYNEAAFYAGQLDFDQLIAKAVRQQPDALNPQFLMANRIRIRFSCVSA